MRNENQEIAEGLEFLVGGGEVTVFKIKKISGDVVTVSWMEDGVERFVDYSKGIVNLTFATKTWKPIPGKPQNKGGQK